MRRNPHDSVTVTEPDRGALVRISFNHIADEQNRDDPGSGTAVPFDTARRGDDARDPQIAGADTQYLHASQSDCSSEYFLG